MDYFYYQNKYLKLIGDYIIRAKCFLYYNSFSFSSSDKFKSNVAILKCYVEEKWNQNKGDNNVYCFNILKELARKHDHDDASKSWLGVYYAEVTCGNLAHLTSLASTSLYYYVDDDLSKNNKMIKETLENIITFSKELGAINPNQKMHIHPYYKELRFDPGAAITEHCKETYILNIKVYAEKLLEEFNELLRGDLSASTIEF